jgi:pimeloyl-ACP methyl ester carboxylesterase
MRAGNPNGTPMSPWHGFLLGAGHVWLTVMPALRQAGLGVLAPDMRGYGDSDKPTGTQGYDARALVEERPDDIVQHALTLTATANGRSPHPLIGLRS